VADVRIWQDIATAEITPVMVAEDADFLKQAADLLPQEPWDETTWGTWTAAIKTATGRKGKDLFMPLRQALTGLDHGPELKVFLPLIGFARAEARLTGQRG
jgi:glutamyl-tRNA synthetase